MSARKKAIVFTSAILVLPILLWGMKDVAAGEENYPTRPVTVIATFKAGGGVDRYTRGLVSITAKDYLGQPMVVKNITGAGGATGALEVYKAKPDGYTLMSIDSSLTTL